MLLSFSDLVILEAGEVPGAPPGGGLDGGGLGAPPGGGLGGPPSGLAPSPGMPPGGGLGGDLGGGLGGPGGAPAATPQPPEEIEIMDPWKALEKYVIKDKKGKHEKVQDKNSQAVSKKTEPQ